MSERLNIGTLVQAKRNPDRDREYVAESVAARKAHDGKSGSVIDTSDAHGLCYLVHHGDGTAWWEPEELRTA